MSSIFHHLCLRKSGSLTWTAPMAKGAVTCRSVPRLFSIPSDSRMHSTFLNQTSILGRYQNFISYVPFETLTVLTFA